MVAKIPKVTIVSKDIIHSLMVPEPGLLPFRMSFSRFEDHAHTQPSQHLAEINQETTVVINPNRWTVAELAKIESRQVWWFMEPVGDLVALKGSRYPSLKKHANRELESRRRYLTKPPRIPEFLIVPDEPSREWAALHHPNVSVSRPPISDRAYRANPSQQMAVNLGFFGERTPYKDLFLSPIEEELADLSGVSVGPDTVLAQLSQCWPGISLGHSAQKEFPYELAVFLALGTPALATPLFPLHGLESGIDYFELTSPEELRHIVDYITRNPRALALMAYRGRQKAEHFRASTVWRELASGPFSVAH